MTKEKTDQSKRFIDVARELGCDEDEAAFDEKLRKIAKLDQATQTAKPQHAGEVDKRPK